MFGKFRTGLFIGHVRILFFSAGAMASAICSHPSGRTPPSISSISSSLSYFVSIMCFPSFYLRLP